jgi:hypothetical protein
VQTYCSLDSKRTRESKKEKTTKLFAG